VECGEEKTRKLQRELDATRTDAEGKGAHIMTWCRIQKPYRQ
jgi:hypothetical protein